MEGRLHRLGSGFRTQDVVPNQNITPWIRHALCRGMSQSVGEFKNLAIKIDVQQD